MEIIKDNCYKGTRTLLGNNKRDKINECITLLKELGFEEIQIPIIHFQETFKDKVGEENNNMMYNFIDRGNRNLCLAPEYTSYIQKLSTAYFKDKKDVKLFYIAECFRGEKPQNGRYRQFTQLGVEILNPSKEYFLNSLPLKLCYILNNSYKYELITNTKRGLDFYKDNKGFEVIVNELGSSKQVCGGGEYENGLGFAIGVDRLV